MFNVGLSLCNVHASEHQVARVTCGRGLPLSSDKKTASVRFLDADFVFLTRSALCTLTMLATYNDLSYFITSPITHARYNTSPRNRKRMSLASMNEELANHRVIVTFQPLATLLAPPPHAGVADGRSCKPICSV